MATEKNVHKLGVARKVERSRIWLEGERLKRAGFTHGKTFKKSWHQFALVLELEKPGKDAKASDFGTVAGSADRPVIDIVGEKVREQFGKGTHVEVIYNGDAGRITIRGA